MPYRDGTQAADALLIAASPDLLAACKARLAADEQIESAATDIDLVAARRARDEANELMREAIAKAEGGAR